MKTLVIGLLLLTSAQSFAAKNVFSAHDTGATAEVACIYAFGGACDLEQMEVKLQDECYQTGFVKCETLIKRRTTKSSHDMFCGYKTYYDCTVTVRGEN